MKTRFEVVKETPTALTLINHQDLPTAYTLENSSEIPRVRESLVCRDENMVFRFTFRFMK